MNADLSITARRDIKPGEEITFDYATSETYEGFEMKCFCNNKECRKMITANDWKNP